MKDLQKFMFVYSDSIFLALKRRGIRGTHLEPSIQDIVDEVAPIKEAPLWG